MFPPPAAAFNFLARLSCSAGMGSGRGAGPPYLGVRSPGVPLPGPGLDEANEKGSRRIALSDRGKDRFAFLSHRPRLAAQRSRMGGVH